MKNTKDNRAGKKAYSSKDSSVSGTGEKGRNIRNDIYIIVALALVVVVIASLAIYKLRTDEHKQQEETKQVQQAMNQQMNDKASSADDIRNGNTQDSDAKNEFNSLSSDDASVFEGTYLVQNESNGINAIQLMPDCEAVVSLIDSNETESGNWLCKEKDGVVLIFLAVYNETEPYQFMVWNNYLIDVKSIYSGEIPDGERFNTTISQSDSLGKMVIKLTDDGKAEADYLNTDPESDENGLTVMYKGTYEVDGDIVEIELAGDASRFLKFDHKSEVFVNDSGLAAVYFKKDN